MKEPFIEGMIIDYPNLERAGRWISPQAPLLDSLQQLNADGAVQFLKLSPRPLPAIVRKI